MPYSDQRRDYAEAMDVDSVYEASLLQHPPRKEVARPCGAKIAFLFLVLDRVETEEIWDDFFSGAGAGCYSVYVHRAAPRSSRGSFQHLPSSFDVAFTASEWCALFGVEAALLREALADPGNQQFVLASHNTVPLKSFGYVYEDLVVHSGARSKVCLASPASLDTCAFRRTAEEGLASVKHHQWLVLRRSHAEAVCADALAALEGFKARGGDGTQGMCNDEFGPALALLINATAEAQARPGELAWSRLDEAGVERRCTTFAYWEGCLQNTTFDLNTSGAPKFHPLALDGVGDEYLRRLAGSSLLFARKFSRNSSVATGAGPQSLRQRLPFHWSKVKFQPGLRPPVPSLDSRGLGGA